MAQAASSGGRTPARSGSGVGAAAVVAVAEAAVGSGGSLRCARRLGAKVARARSARSQRVHRIASGGVGQWGEVEVRG